MLESRIPVRAPLPFERDRPTGTSVLELRYLINILPHHWCPFVRSFARSFARSLDAQVQTTDGRVRRAKHSLLNLASSRFRARLLPVLPSPLPSVRRAAACCIIHTQTAEVCSNVSAPSVPPANRRRRTSRKPKPTTPESTQIEFEYIS
jgi:hypothetical protein